MARKKCPACGRPYNGKRCASCLYEPFGNEISCDEHHKETVFDDGKTVRTAPQAQPRQDIPRQTPSWKTAPRQAAPRPYGQTSANSGSNSGKKKKTTLGRVLRIIAIIYGIVILVNVASGLFFAGLRDSFSGAFDIGGGPEPVPEIAMPVGGTVLYDQAGLLIKTDWEENTAYVEDVSIFFRNETNRDLTLSAREITVNGYVVDTSYLYCEAAAGITGIGYLRLDEEALADAGIETVAEISFYLDIFDSDSYEDVVQTDTITLTAAVPEGFTQPVDDSGTLLLEQDGIKVVCKGYRPDSYYPEDVQEGTIQFFVENNTDRYLSFYTPEVLVNEESSSLNLWCQLRPGTRTVTDMYLYSLEDLGIDSIDDIDTIALILGISDADDWEYVIETEALCVDIAG